MNSISVATLTALIRSCTQTHTLKKQRMQIGRGNKSTSHLVTNLFSDLLQLQ